MWRSAVVSLMLCSSLVNEEPADGNPIGGVYYHEKLKGLLFREDDQLVCWFAPDLRLEIPFSLFEDQAEYFAKARWIRARSDHPSGGQMQVTFYDPDREGKDVPVGEMDTIPFVLFTSLTDGEVASLTAKYEGESFATKVTAEPQRSIFSVVFQYIVIAAAVFAAGLVSGMFCRPFGSRV